MKQALEKQNLLEKTTYLKHQYWNNLKEKNLIMINKVEKLYTTYLNNNPFDSEIWLELAIFEYGPPFADYIQAISCLNKILAYDPKNTYAILILSYIQYHEFGRIEEKVFQQVNQIVTQDKELASIVEFVKSWHYKVINNDFFHENALLKSIEHYQHHVWNYVELGIFYIQKQKKIYGQNYINLGIKNIKGIYEKNYTPNYTTELTEFFNEQIKGIYLTQPVVDWIINYLD